MGLANQDTVLKKTFESLHDILCQHTVPFLCSCQAWSVLHFLYTFLVLVAGSVYIWSQWAVRLLNHLSTQTDTGREVSFDLAGIILEHCLTV